MRRAADAMRSPVATVSPEMSVSQACRSMLETRQVCMPVVSDDQLVGVVSAWELFAQHPNRLVADAMVSPAPTISPEASIWEAWEQLERERLQYLIVVDGGRAVGLLSRLYVKAEVMHYMDPLTGLPRAELLKDQALALMGGGGEVSVTFLDLDDFRTVNKLLGHLVGDQLLRRAALVLRQALGSSGDLVGRYGGDEFVVVSRLAHVDAQRRAEDLVMRLNESLKAGRVSVSVSAGVAGGRRNGLREGLHPGRMLDDLINLASLRSTEAKKTGRRVVGEGAVTPMPAAG